MRLYIIACLFAYVYSSTTPASGGGKVLIDFHHHKAMIVRAAGCYEYHMNHQDVVDAQNPTTRPAFEAKIIAELDANIQLVQKEGHHHIDHMTQDIKTACAALPVYGFEVHATTMTT